MLAKFLTASGGDRLFPRNCAWRRRLARRSKIRQPSVQNSEHCTPTSFPSSLCGAHGCSQFMPNFSWCGRAESAVPQFATAAARRTT